MARLFIGCSGFTYQHWRGNFYPESLPQSHWFAHYRSTFSTVELNVTFYHLPKPETFDKWRQESGGDFTFAVKGSRFITHVKRLNDPAEALERFFAAATHLQEKLSVVLWQLAPGFGLDIDRFSRFLSLLKPYNIRNTFEFRNQSWITDDIIALCREHNAALCVADWPPFIVDLEPTADFVYIRRHGHGSYDGRYSLEDLGKDAERIRGFIREGRDVYVYFNNDIGGFAPVNALELRGMLEKG